MSLFRPFSCSSQCRHWQLSLVVSLFSLSCYADYQPIAPSIAQVMAPMPPTPQPQAMVIDGKFDEPQWQQAQRFNTFYQVVPASLEPHPAKAEMRVFTNQAGIYVGITNFQPQGARQQQYNLQDGFMQADFNNIMIDLAGDGSAAYLFSITLGGGIKDAAITAQLDSDDDWDGVWQVAQQVTPDDWSTEFFLPWHAVSFRHRQQANGQSQLGISVQLYELATNHVYGSQPQSLAHSDFFLEMPKLWVEVPAQADWQLRPYLKVQHDNLQHQVQTEAGLDFHYKPAHHQQLSLALNPDFGQVDSDELALNYSNVETLYTDKRPFFTQDLSLFSTLSLQNTQMIHTRRIGAGSDDGSMLITPIDAAVRFTHQGESVHLGAFAVKEDTLDSGVGKTFYVARSTWRQPQWQTGLLATHTKRPGLHREAETLTWDSQYQSSTWSFQSALARSEITQQSNSLLQSIRTKQQSGLALSARGKYQFTPRFNLGLELLKIDDSFDNNDLGYLQRPNWREQALLSDYAYSPNISGISRIKHQVRLSAQTDDHALKIPAQQLYLLSFLLSNGAQTELQLAYQTSGWQDNIGYQSDAFALPAAWSRRLMYISPYVGQLSWATSFQLDQQGFTGLSRQFAVDLTWLPHSNWTLNFNNFYREGDDWLIANQHNQLSSYDSALFASQLKISGLLSDGLELGFHLQWALLDAQSQQRWQIRQRQLQLDLAAKDSSFVDQRLTAQLKLRYKIGAYSDFYLVYNRGANFYSQQQSAADDLSSIANLWQSPNQSLWTAKIRYAF